MSLVVELPDDALRNVASLLCAPDLLNFLSSHPHLYQLSKSEGFWRSLMDSNNNTNDTTMTMTPPPQTEEGFQVAKQAYLTRAYVNTLPMVQWKLCRSSRMSPTGREGHMACTMGSKLVITGGFTDDERIYILDTRNGTAALEPDVMDWQRVDPAEVKSWRHADLPPPHPALFRNMQHLPPGAVATELSSVYGATLTPIDDKHAIRFGGFRAGGYSAECNEIALLTLSENYTDDNSDNSVQQPEVSATWQVIHPKNHCAPRAYHTATLLAKRYLVIIGGMCESGCIRSEAILDTKTWTWLNDTSVTHEMKLPKPTGRHGHSAVLDDKRDRIVVFGGGSGTDLLRSGRDNAEVWELRMGRQWKNAENSLQELQASLPWEWNPVLMNEGDDDEDVNVDEDAVHHQRMVDANNNASLQDIDDDDDDDIEDFLSAQDDHSENSDLPPPLGPRVMHARNNNDAGGQRGVRSQQEARAPAPNPRQLSDVEKLSLGRCHLGFKVGPDTVLFAFGSGRPSTNGTLGFNLATNSFIRPRQGAASRLPPPRFTCAGTVFGEYNSYLLVHGGYSTQEGMAIGNMSVLDLAPAVRRQFTALPDNPGLQASPPVTQQDLNRHSMFGGHHFGFGGHMGIGGMEDLLQNLFVEFANGAGGMAIVPNAGRRQVGRRPDRGPRIVARGGGLARGDLDGDRNLGELLGLLAGRRGRDADEDDDDDDDDIESENGDLEEDDDEEEGPGVIFQMIMGGDEEEEEDDDSSYDSANISEVS